VREQEVAAKEANTRTDNNAETQPISTVALVRFAFQQVYAPDRLIKPVAGIHEAKIKDARVIKHLFPGRGVLAKPLAQWRTPEGRYVTALYVRNTEQRIVELDPRQIRAGRGWSTASFLTGVLAPASNIGDSTTMVVVSDGAWKESTAWLR
jgi:integrating conjugative element protein (TIGR03749 family)